MPVVIGSPWEISGERKGSFGMPSLGLISANCAPGATGEVQAFATTLKRLIHHVRPGATMAEKAKALHVSPPLLSHWLNGRRLPRPAAIGDLSRLALEEVVDDRDVAALAYEFAALESLLHAARRSAFRRCAGGCNWSEAAGKGDRRNAIPGSADEGDRRNKSSSAPAGKGDGVGGASIAAPLRGGRGALLPKPDFSARLAAMTVSDRIDILQGLGATLSEGGIGAVADALARASMKEEMEVIIRYAESTGSDSVEIAVALGGLR